MNSPHRGLTTEGRKMTREQSREAAIAMDSGRAAIMAVLQSGEVSAQDVERLRKTVFRDGFVSREEADALFALEASPASKCAEWTALFVEAVTDHIVWEARPTGVVNEGQGEWLIARADTAASLNALAALVNVLGHAHRVPLWFLAAVKARAMRGWAGVDVGRLMAQSDMAEAA